MSLAPDRLGYHPAGEVDDDTYHAAPYCEHCDQVVATDITRHRTTYTFTCPNCRAHNEIEDPHA